MTKNMTALPARPTWFLRRGFLLAVVAYALMLVGVIMAMLNVRQVTLETMGTPEAQANWQDWRESEPNQSTDLPVKRKPPKSSEPPSLVLMRDHFPVLLSAAIVFSSLLFIALAIAARGVLGQTAWAGTHVATKPEEPPRE